MEILRFHHADGALWYGDDQRVAVAVWGGLEALPAVLSRCTRPPALVRVLGSRSNAALIVRLRRELSGTPIWIGSPSSVYPAANRCDPVAVLRCLLQLEVTSALAGWWHIMTAADYHAYSLIAGLDAGMGPDDPVVGSHLRCHPAWPGLSFLAGPDELIDRVEACRLLAEIVDPRWFRHPYRPHRASRLRAYLGLNPTNVRSLLGLCPPSRHFERALIAVRTWYNPAALDAYGRNRCIGPNHFLWRVYAAQRTVVRGVLRATERMLDFVVNVWQGGVDRPHAEVGFMASRYLRPAEFEAYNRHRNTH